MLQKNLPELGSWQRNTTQYSTYAILSLACQQCSFLLPLLFPLHLIGQSLHHIYTIDGSVYRPNPQSTKSTNRLTSSTHPPPHHDPPALAALFRISVLIQTALSMFCICSTFKCFTGFLISKGSLGFGLGGAIALLNGDVAEGSGDERFIGEKQNELKG